jgi:hypothetical protein
MFEGEFEASNVSFGASPGTNHVTYLLFVFLVAIILSDLLIGLAVGDKNLIRKEAESLSIEAREALSSKIERMSSKLPTFIKPKKISKEIFTFYPNRQHSTGSTAVQCLLHSICKKGQPTKE